MTRTNRFHCLVFSPTTTRHQQQTNKTNKQIFHVFRIKYHIGIFTSHWVFQWFSKAWSWRGDELQSSHTFIPSSDHLSMLISRHFCFPKSPKIFSAIWACDFFNKKSPSLAHSNLESNWLSSFFGAIKNLSCSLEGTYIVHPQQMMAADIGGAWINNDVPSKHETSKLPAMEASCLTYGPITRG